MRAIDADKLHLDKFDDNSTEYRRGWNDALDITAKKAPTIEVPRWIPVTERLPTKEDADRFGRVFAVDKDKRMNDTNWRVVNWYHETFSHWMPLPDAPMEDSNA